MRQIFTVIYRLLIVFFFLRRMTATHSVYIKVTENNTVQSMCGIFAYLSQTGKSLDGVSVAQGCTVAMNCKHRGPDNTVITSTGKDGDALFVFHRLAIMDMSSRGLQPMTHPTDEKLVLMCNGEIYNYKQLCETHGFKTASGSDCEVILHMYKKFGIKETISALDGVFAFVLYDGNTNTYYAGRDPFGIRSLFIGYTKTNGIVLASELKSVAPLCSYSRHFLPGSYWCSEQPHRFRIYEKLKFSYFTTMNASSNPEKDVSKRVVELLQGAVRKRMMSDREIGCFLSGGLDSSLVAALVAKEYNDPKSLHTYSIGMKGSTDLKYARMVADFIGTTHHEVLITKEDMLNALPEVVRLIESYDTTTVRASTPMYLLSKWIKENTNTTVVFSGEGSDELSGSYMYFHNCPSVKAFQSETTRLIQDLHYFDIVRCDKSVSGAGLEPRIPFLDMDFIRYYMNMPPEYKMPRNGVEKYFLRKAFEDMNLLPKEVLWRTKEAFSDGVSSVEDSWYSTIQTFIDTQISDKEMSWQTQWYTHNPPQLKETLYYRKLFDEAYPGCAHIVPYYWLPKWSGDGIADPSARVLDVYQ